MEVNRLINYIDENDNIVMKHLVKNFLIQNEDGLAILVNSKYPPGTQAYLADESKVWELDANYEWQLKVKEDSASENNNNDNDNYDNNILTDAMIVECDMNTMTLNKTEQEIWDAMNNHKPVFIYMITSSNVLYDCIVSIVHNNYYYLGDPYCTIYTAGDRHFYTVEPNEYPIMQP